MDPKLTRRQEEILNFVRKFTNDNGYPPTVREIGEAVGLASSSSVFRYLGCLEQKGYLRRDPTKPRTIELLTLDDESCVGGETEACPIILSPIIGRVAAGRPILAIENIEGYFPLARHFVNAKKAFVLKVQGTSMIEAGILDGDYIIVGRQDTAQNGEIVVAMTEDDEVTVKRFFKEDGFIRLHPENQTMEDLIYPNVRILGKVIGTFRSLK